MVDEEAPQGNLLVVVMKKFVVVLETMVVVLRVVDGRARELGGYCAGDGCAGGLCAGVLD